LSFIQRQQICTEMINILYRVEVLVESIIGEMGCEEDRYDPCRD